ncbi:uncharacterized protein LOC130692532 [Daphnia carinata]|uniref:uncharacterized protein LOC130692532 n=1 Tax=Daphnia carinata TaxID=120202 RepID=UPI00257968A1|nr:uncharacterized protein LOC130692532 [Daphnia carinata]
MGRLFAVFLLFAIFNLPALTAHPLDIQVGIDPNRPLALYEGPQTYRRDARGRPFKSIILTSSKLFGIGSNLLRDSSTSSSTTATTTTTTTTPPPPPRSPLNVGQRLKPFVVTSKPFGFANPASNLLRESTTTSTTTPSPFADKATPTIPFFSISCTVGSSCSQIISARQTQTAKPTFKPYTKEEIDKFKGGLGSRFPPKIGSSSVNIQSPNVSTTEKPSTEKLNSLWRIRTTLPPVPTITSSTTTIRPNPVKSKPADNWSSGWKWPAHIESAASENHKQDEIESSNQRVESGTSEWAAVKPSSQGQTGFSVHPVRTNIFSAKPYSAKEKHDYVKGSSILHRPEGNMKIPATAGSNHASWLSLLAASLSVLHNQNHSQRPHSHLQETRTPPPPLPLSEPFPMKTTSRPFKLRPDSSVAPVEQDRWHSLALTNKEEENSLIEPKKPSGVVGYSISLPEKEEDYRHHEVISSKGNKISLITGALNRNKQTQNPVKAVQNNQHKANSANLPPEVSVSSHVIGLRIKPKSLGGTAFIEHVQGTALETDGENVNLSDLIMKHDLPQRPARFLPHRQRSFVTFDEKSGWRPVRFPNA